MNLLSRHNLGFFTEHLDWPMFYDVDYERGTIKLKTPNRPELREIRIISRKAFAEKTFTEDEVCTVALKQKIPPSAKDKKVVVCTINHCPWCRPHLGEREVETIKIFKPSTQVRNLGDEVIRDFAPNKKFIFLHV